MNKWEHVYGDLVDGLREAIIDALILRFTKPTKMFYFKGKRMVIDIGWTNGGGSWHIYANRFFIGTIAYPRTGTDFRFLIHNEAEWLTDEMKEEFISMLKRKEIKWPDDDLPNIPLS
ncbi:MAG: hypothetical protein LBF27_30830 [Sphingobacterium sp.]|nr:hypothetical protein [Sphingobacterium sp.]